MPSNKSLKLLSSTELANLRTLDVVYKLDYYNLVDFIGFVTNDGRIS